MCIRDRPYSIVSWTKRMAQRTSLSLKGIFPVSYTHLDVYKRQIVDTMMVGRQANSAVAIGAVSLGGILYIAVAIFGTGLMLGLDTLVSHAYGAGDLEECHRVLVNGVYLSLGISPVLMGLVMLFGPIMRSLNIQGSVLNQAVPYLHALNLSLIHI